MALTTLVVALGLAMVSSAHAAIGANCNTNDDCFDTNAQGYCNPTAGTAGFLGKCAACSTGCNTCAGPDTDDCTSCAPQSSATTSRATNRFPLNFTPVPARTTKGSCASCSSAAPGPNPSAAQCTDAICPGFYYTPAPIGGSSSCQVCDPSCATCNGGNPTQCTSCPADTFLTTGSTSGSGACLACGSQNTATACSKANCPSRYFVPTAGTGGRGDCLACDGSCATCNGPASNQCTSCRTSSLLRDRTFLSFSGAGAGAGSGTCARCDSASQAACTTDNCPSFFYANQDSNSNGFCVACSRVGNPGIGNIAFCNAQNCPNFYISQALGQPNSAQQSCFSCVSANTPAECSAQNCPSYFLNKKGTAPTNDDTCDRVTSAPTPTPTPTGPTGPTPTPAPGPTATTCPASDEYRTSGGCKKCVAASSPFKQRLGGYDCVNAITASAQSTDCIPFTLKAYPRKAGTSGAAIDTCIRQTATDNIVSVLLETKDSNVPFLTSASYVKGSLRLNNIKPRTTSSGEVIFIKKGDLRLVQFVDRFREIRGKAPKDIFLTGVLRPYAGATTNLRCFKASLKVCA